MLDVVADVEGDQVEGSVVRVSLLALRVHVVLGDKVARDRVKTQRQHGAREKVHDRLGTPVPHDPGVEQNLDGNSCAKSVTEKQTFR